MSASFEPAPPVGQPAPTCPQCAEPVDSDAERCRACGYALAGVDGRPGPYGPMWGLGAGLALAVAYGITLAIVLLGR